MKLDDWKAGTLPETDPWAVEALKRGLIQPRNPYTNPDLSPKETRGFQPDPMAQTVKGLPGKLLTQADENLTKNITALTPKPSESPYGSIRMPRMSDDPENAGNFVMAGPIAVEQALSKITAKVLPAKAIQDKLLQMGAGKAELETRGVTQFLESKGVRPIFPKEVAKHLEENPYQLKEVTKTTSVAGMDPNKSYSVPKFEAYQTPGGENYREILLQAPTGPEKAADIMSLEEFRRAKFATAPGGNVRPDVIQSEYDRYISRENAKITGAFTGGHWDEPNVVAHMRVNDRTLPSGEKALHVEEWQSDWSNKLRENKAAGGGGGYSVEQMSEHGKGTDWFVYNHLGEEVAGPFKTPGEGNQWVKKVGPDVPSHPLVDNWQDLMARRTLKEAADGGYDRLTWTTGQQQADRYDLSKTFKEISYFKNKEGNYDLHGVFTQGDVLDATQLASGVPESKLADYVGKDIAKKIANKEGNLVRSTNGRSLSGLDLKVGGEWAKKLYDESMVNRFNKIGKRYGVQVEDLDIAQGTKHPETYAHSLKITPEMRQSIGAAKFHPFADLPGPK